MAPHASPKGSRDVAPSGAVEAAALAYRQRAMMLGLEHVGQPAIHESRQEAASRSIPDNAVPDAAAAYRRRTTQLGIDPTGEEATDR